MKLFLDANVIFAAAISPGGRARALFALAEGGYATLLTSSFAVDEARRNVVRKYPAAEAQLKALLEGCSRVAEGSPEHAAWARDYLPAKDAPILAAAVAAQADMLVTGDRAHFGLLYGRHFEKTEVVSLAAALGRFLSDDQPKES